MNNLLRRIEAIERSRNTAASSTMIPAVEVAAVEATLRRKLGLPAEIGYIPAPISRKALEGASALQKLRRFLERTTLVTEMNLD
jgi:hypothetical protein